MFGIGVSGLGKHVRNRILPALSSMDKLSLIGVCSRNKNTVSDCADQWNCEGWTDFEQMANDPSVDIVYIGSPIGIHSVQVSDALKAGKHVFCEKPLTCAYKDTERLVRLAEKNKRVLAEGFMYLYHSQFKRVMKFAKGHEAGRICSVTCRFGIPLLIEPGFRNDPDLGGGAFWDVASYTVSAALSLFPGQPVEVIFSEIRQKKCSPVDTEGRSILRFSGDITVYLEWGVGVGYKNEIELWAEHGSFYADKIFSKPVDFLPVFQIRDKNGNQRSESGLVQEQFIEMLRHFHVMLGDAKRAAEERNRILELANLMDNIEKRSKINIF